MNHEYKRMLLKILEDDGKNVDKGLSPKELEELEQQLTQVNADPFFRKLGSAQKVTKM